MSLLHVLQKEMNFLSCQLYTGFNLLDMDKTSVIPSTCYFWINMNYPISWCQGMLIVHTMFEEDVIPNAWVKKWRLFTCF